MTTREQAIYEKQLKANKCKILGINEAQYDIFKRIAQKLHRISENQCNGYLDYQGNWDQLAADKEEAKENQLKEKAEQMAKDNNLFIFFQGDPRGGTLFLDTKEIPYNNYTNAYCIY